MGDKNITFIKEKKELKSLSNKKNALDFKKIINEHLAFIEKQCFRVIKLQMMSLSGINHPIHIENEALELSNYVLDRLEKNDYQILRNYRGHAKLTTYLTIIISNQAVDLMRKKRGRDRKKERAKNHGILGKHIYEMVFVQGILVSEVYKELKSSKGISESFEELETIVEKIRGKVRHNNIYRAEAPRNEHDSILPDYKNNPEEIFVEKERIDKISDILITIVSELKGEDSLILRMRFLPDGEKEPENVEQISNILGISKKTVYERIKKVMEKCREIMKQEGISRYDLF
jgi:RNA polymerase sigma factor (sigma-70 family)